MVVIQNPLGEIFISYRRDDSRPTSGRIFDALQDHLCGGRIFMDVDSIRPGADFTRTIENAANSCSAMLAIIGGSWLTAADEAGRRRLDNPSDYVAREIAIGLDRNIPVIPILVDGAQAPRPDDLPPQLRTLAHRQCLRLSNDSFGKDILPILEELERIIVACGHSGSLFSDSPEMNSKSALQSFWPPTSADLAWPMADHSAARAAFVALLDGNSQQRALLVCGASQTGKTHMSESMAEHLRPMNNIRSARFDLKGTIGMDLQIQELAASLDVNTPYNGPLSERLDRILEQLRTPTKPTVMIFDSCEAAGELRDWLETVLPKRVYHAPWLRIVAIGQYVPDRAHTVWELIAPPTLALGSPTIEHWFEYGRANRGEGIQLKFVEQVYELVNGNPGPLAALFGPRNEATNGTR